MTWREEAPVGSAGGWKTVDAAMRSAARREVSHPAQAGRAGRFRSQVGDLATVTTFDWPAVVRCATAHDQTPAAARRNTSRCSSMDRAGAS